MLLHPKDTNPLGCEQAAADKAIFPEAAYCCIYACFLAINYHILQIVSIILSEGVKLVCKTNLD
jgi:hypothetical protein